MDIPVRLHCHERSHIVVPDDPDNLTWILVRLSCMLETTNENLSGVIKREYKSLPVSIDEPNPRWHYEMGLTCFLLAAAKISGEPWGFQG